VTPLLRGILLFAAGLAGQAAAGAEAPVRPDKPAPPKTFEEVLDQLPRGTHPDNVRRVLGHPKRVARQILSHRHLEQWLYDQPCPLRIDFDCPRGQKPQVVKVRRLTEPGR
jgi:hypothetical protein